MFAWSRSKRLTAALLGFSPIVDKKMLTGRHSSPSWCQHHACHKLGRSEDVPPPTRSATYRKADALFIIQRPTHMDAGTTAFLEAALFGHGQCLA